MSVSQSSPQNPSYSPSQALALIIGAFGVGFPPFLYWHAGSSFLGHHPLVKIFAISGISGVLSFALYAGRKWWLLAGLIGFFGGIGAAGALLFYTTVFHRETMLTTEIALVQVAGAAPAMAVFAHIARRKSAIN